MEGGTNIQTDGLLWYFPKDIWNLISPSGNQFPHTLHYTPFKNLIRLSFATAINTSRAFILFDSEGVSFFLALWRSVCMCVSLYPSFCIHHLLSEERSFAALVSFGSFDTSSAFAPVEFPKHKTEILHFQASPRKNPFDELNDVCYGVEVLSSNRKRPES